METNKRSSGIKIGIAAKLIGMSVLPVVLLGVILTAYGQVNLKKSLKNEIHGGLKSVALAVQGAYDAAGNGDFIMLESGNVIKGMFVVSGNYSLADKLSKDSGIDISLYYGNKMVVTSLTDGNKNRLTEGTVSKEVKETVLNGGKEFFAEDVQIGSDHYYSYYMPLFSEDGSVDGMIFAGKKSQQVEKTLAADAVKMIMLSAVVILAAFLLTVAMSVSIARALKRTMSQFGKVADGNLSEQGTEDIGKRCDEIGAMLHGVEKLRGSLRGMIGSIRHSSGVLLESADELERAAALTSEDSDKVGRAISDVSAGAAAQAKETEEAMADVENMGGIIGEMTENISAVAQITCEVGQAGNEVNSILAELLKYTEKTTNAVDIIARQIQTTNDSAQEIQKAVEMITSIAEETNLLSLNASIEAARAGEQGRGFAIVATQIQKLAEQSSTSAQQIKQIIQVLLDDAGATVDKMEQVVGIVGNQKEKLMETGGRFETVNSGIQKMVEKMDGIRKLSGILDNSRNHMVNMIASLSAISEENAAASEETAASTEQLNERVKQITEEAAILKKLAAELERQIGIFQMEE